MTPYGMIRQAMRSQLWAIQPEKLEQICAFLQLKAAGGSPSPELLAAIQADAAAVQARAQAVSAAGGGSVAVLPVYGLILYRGSSMGDISGPTATSVQKLTQQFRQALNDPNVKAIVFDVDSPGGTVEGVDELATEIRNARGQKKTIAVADHLMASAAYYLASACSEVVVSPSSLTGSVGVYCAHEDDSKYLEDLGVKISLVSFGENKTLGNSYEPLSDAARADMQDMVDQFGAMFEKAVAKGRKISQAKVHEAFGQGLCFTAQKAVKIGMADTVGTLDDVLGRYGVGAGAADSGSSSRMSMQTSADDDTDCPCDCGPCRGGDCAGCSHEGCACVGCTCDAATGSATKAFHARLKRRLELASA
jgi:capsid assembly protease